MTPDQLAGLIGALPVPWGSWAREAVYGSPVALRVASGRPPREVAEEIAVRLRRRDGIDDVRVRPDGFLLIAVSRPGEVAGEIVRKGPPEIRERAALAPDFPRTWDNPGFVVRYAHARAAAVQRWARDLGVPEEGFRPEPLDDPHDRAVLRLLAELPTRAASRDPAWEAYAGQLALAYHDAHEHAPAVPVGDQPVNDVHTARLWLATAVRTVLAALFAVPLPDRL
ncbi:DALR anticodon-binding domain-containing protein [Microtetraspora sp. NBRC 16547]|uniref:DALR anticodon-binding domain-containing protein n=1 Tax=Microtetraspora sp. NBRC 16547 TaxID=3030993 RepID=UPI002553035D|nr:DALR anticodon-binding domain-containing protein [Microtetraspora sp. NBRC 16547]